MSTSTLSRAACAAVVTIPLVALVVMGVTGCTASAPPHPAAPTATTAVPHDGTITQITHRPGTQTGYVGALKDVRIGTCSADASPAHFEGTVTNPTSTEQSYRIYVSLQSAGSTIGVHEVDVRGVPGHATEKWSGTLPAGKPGATCLLRVERHS
ncbi:hypothetical protein KNO15_03095 [Leifsonia shinshuensis]|uniref:hypothetical protein n=1 Tax=Leifsonia shinshuensis TaxID=150026 RepID=UPI001F50E67E|nr:hypothetical protein [Leifsonia shinshuensis]MCI0155681.1 hypothetical protein [Leifsonia shinshuensis]